MKHKRVGSNRIESISYGPGLKESLRDERRREKLAKIKSLLGLLLTLALVIAGFIYFIFPMMRDEIKPAAFEGPYKVLRTVDGDTFTADVDGQELKIRLIGVDAPESAHFDSSKNIPEGQTAAEFLKDLIEGEKVWLEFDAEREDRYGRLLAYVYLSDQKTMVQKVMLEKGAARIMTVPPNVRYQDEFLKLQKQARRKKAGFWAGSAFAE